MGRKNNKGKLGGVSSEEWAGGGEKKNEGNPLRGCERKEKRWLGVGWGEEEEKSFRGGQKKPQAGGWGGGGRSSQGGGEYEVGGREEGGGEPGGGEEMERMRGCVRGGERGGGRTSKIETGGGEKKRDGEREERGGGGEKKDGEREIEKNRVGRNNKRWGRRRNKKK